MSRSNCFVVVFRDDSITKAIYNCSLPYPPTKIPQGEYVVVNCEIGNVGGERIGVTKVDALRVTTSQTVGYEDLCFLHDGTPSSIIATPMPTTTLTVKQRKKTVDAVKKYEPWWWNNAPKEVKSALQATFSKADEARELVRQGVDLVSKQRYDDAKNLIQKGLSLYPEMGCARVELGKISIELGLISEAIRWFEDELKLVKEESDELMARDYLAVIYQARGDMAKAELHRRAAMETEEYRRHPTSLHSEVVQKIRLAVQSSTRAVEQETHTHEPQSAKGRRWWQFWK